MSLLHRQIFGSRVGAIRGASLIYPDHVAEPDKSRAGSGVLLLSKIQNSRGKVKFLSIYFLLFIQVLFPYKLACFLVQIVDRNTFKYLTLAFF